MDQRFAAVFAAAVAACGDNLPAPQVLEIVGHSDLMARGMNAAPALAGDHAYIGSRTDGAFHDHAGVLIVDVSDPAAPSVVGEIDRPEQALVGMTSRELLAVPDKNLLIVLDIACSRDLHDCERSSSFGATGGVEETDNLRFYDITDPVDPQLIARHDLGSSPANPGASAHEMFLWRDPADPDRILLYMSTPSGPPALTVLDISDPSAVVTVATWDPELDAGLDEPRGPTAYLHSVSVSDDGRTALLSYAAAGVLLVDTSDIADGAAEPELRLLHDQAARADWSPPEPAGVHSAVPVPGRDIAIATDEVYPQGYGAGCPWGWVHIIDTSNPAAPEVVGEYKLPENGGSLCTAEAGPARVTFTAHNTTATESLAFITWHAGGLQVIDTTEPAAPAQVGELRPTPVASVAVEDPALGGEPVIMWSYPIVRDGLIYVVDIRNGLYVLRYNGPHREELEQLGFAEGNSNL